MCKVLKVSKSDYDFWLQSGPSRLWLENQKISSLTPYLRLVFKAIALQGKKALFTPLLAINPLNTNHFTPFTIK